MEGKCHFLMLPFPFIFLPNLSPFLKYTYLPPFFFLGKIRYMDNLPLHYNWILGHPMVH